jgi:pimeloyl-ACP methyl ester carboxylesterase
VALAAQVHGTGRPLVLLPWFGTDHWVMAAAWEPALERSGCRRIYLDLPGTGGSSPVPPHSDAVADAVAETIGALAGDSPIGLIGCSYGGYLAAELARRDPARIAGLMLVCSGVRILPGDRDLSGVLPPDPEPGWLDEVPARYREHVAQAVGHQTKAAAARLTAAFLHNGPVDEEYLSDLRANGYQLSEERALRALDVDVTVVAGRRDGIAGFRDQFELAAASRGGDYVLLDNAGHYLPFEQPARFAALALDWLARLAATR